MKIGKFIVLGLVFGLVALRLFADDNIPPTGETEGCFVLVEYDCINLWASQDCEETTACQRAGDVCGTWEAMIEGKKYLTTSIPIAPAAGRTKEKQSIVEVKCGNKYDCICLPGAGGGGITRTALVCGMGPITDPAKGSYFKANREISGEICPGVPDPQNPIARD